MFDAAEITRPRPNAQSQTEEKPYEPIFYLIHIASSGPDKMIKPAFNNNPAFDNVTWETLPAEISKVCLIYIEITLKPTFNRREKCDIT